MHIRECITHEWTPLAKPKASRQWPQELCGKYSASGAVLKVTKSLLDWFKYPQPDMGSNLIDKHNLDNEVIDSVWRLEFGLVKEAVSNSFHME